LSFQGPIIFVDESGDPGLNLHRSRCRYFTIGFVYAPSPGILRKKLRRILKRAHLRGRYPPQTGELKFYLPETDLIQKGLSKKDIARFRAQMPDLRKKSIDAITSSQAQTFVAVVDKVESARLEIARGAIQFHICSDSPCERYECNLPSSHPTNRIRQRKAFSVWNPQVCSILGEQGFILRTARSQAIQRFAGNT